jgi:hypothetical protein
MKRTALGLAIALALSTTPLIAAGNNKTQPSSIILNTPTQVASSGTTAWEPKLGDYVTFTVSYPKTLDHYGVRIQVLCYQDGNLGFAMAGPYDYSFLLGGAMSQWYLTGGPATCHADLYYWSYNGGQKFNLLASTDFDAAGR